MSQEIQVKIPDIGGAAGVDVIELLVNVGDEIRIDTPLVTLESDKATMEIPASQAGKVSAVLMKVGDVVSEGDVILTLIPHDADKKPLVVESVEEPVLEVMKPTPEPDVAVVLEVAKPDVLKPDVLIDTFIANDKPSTLISAGPSVRRMARELGVDLSDVKGSGRKDRISKEDIQAYVKSKLANSSTASGFSMPQAPVIDFTRFGDIETKPLKKIKRLTGINVHRSWITIPHVTQFDEADITELDAFRQSEANAANNAGYKLTILAFVTKVVSKALATFPQFNASLDSSGEHLIYKKYYNIGIAVETPDGLVVPVIKAVNQLSVGEIAAEMARLSKKAREKGIGPADMAGGCFTISSLGGIGGTAFTPIVNSPEVAILGLSRSAIKPIYDGKDFKPRLMLPLSLSYDHRVIDGAEAARFTRYIADMLSDIRRILL